MDSCHLAYRHLARRRTPTVFDNPDPMQAVGPKVFENCASFLYIEYDTTEPGLNYLDNTRVHPEDYELANKMAADAMDMDETAAGA